MAIGFNFLKQLLLLITILVITDVALPGYIQRIALTIMLFLIVVDIRISLTKIVVVFLILFFEVIYYFGLMGEQGAIAESQISSIPKYMVNYIWILGLFILFSKSRLIFNYKIMFYVGFAHVCVFYAQFFLFYIGDSYVDFYSMFHVGSQRAHSYGFIASFVPLRSAGMFVEPSTYVSVLFVLLMILNQGMGRNLTRDLIFLPTFALSFSGLGVVLTVFYLLVYFKTFRVVTFVAVVISLTIWGDNLEVALDPEYLVTFTSRSLLLEYLFSRDAYMVVLGEGLFSISEALYRLSNGSLQELRAASLNDNGWLVFLFLQGGILGGLLWLVLYKRAIDKKSFLLASFTKLSHMHPLFLLLLVFNDKKS